MTILTSYRLRSLNILWEWPRNLPSSIYIHSPTPCLIYLRSLPELSRSVPLFLFESKFLTYYQRSKIQPCFIQNPSQTSCINVELISNPSQDLGWNHYEICDGWEIRQGFGWFPVSIYISDSIFAYLPMIASSFRCDFGLVLILY